jgi:hypothetical protein
MSEQQNTQATEQAADKKVTRTQAFSRNFGDFTGPLTLTPSDEVKASGVSAPLSFDLSAITGYGNLPKSARIVLARGIADQLTQVFATTLRPSKEEPEGGTIRQALDDMKDVFAEIIEGTFSYGRTGTGAGKVQGVALTAALMVAAQYGLATREEAMQHPHYAPIKQRLQDMLQQADDLAEKAAAITLPVLSDKPTDEEKAAFAEAKKPVDELNAMATGLRSAYMSLAKNEAVSTLRNKWYPPKAKESAPAITLGSVFEGLEAAPAAQ